MPWGYAAAAVGSVVAARSQKKAAQTAAEAQTETSTAQVDEYRRQFDEVQKVLAPFVGAGAGALTAYQNLLGLGGGDAQKLAIDGISSSPEFAALTQQGENAILQNASATGGLRGGDVQAALAQFRPQLLSQLINQQYSRLGGLVQQGQAAAAGQASAGLQTGQLIGGALGDMGAARAGSAVAAGQANANLFSQLAQGGMTYGLLRQLKGP